MCAYYVTVCVCGGDRDRDTERDVKYVNKANERSDQKLLICTNFLGQQGFCFSQQTVQQTLAYQPVGMHAYIQMCGRVSTGTNTLHLYCKLWNS